MNPGGCPYFSVIPYFTAHTQTNVISHNGRSHKWVCVAAFCMGQKHFVFWPVGSVAFLVGSPNCCLNCSVYSLDPTPPLFPQSHLSGSFTSRTPIHTLTTNSELSEVKKFYFFPCVDFSLICSGDWNNFLRRPPVSSSNCALGLMIVGLSWGCERSIRNT